MLGLTCSNLIRMFIGWHIVLENLTKKMLMPNKTLRRCEVGDDLDEGMQQIMQQTLRRYVFFLYV